LVAANRSAVHGAEFMVALLKAGAGDLPEATTEKLEEPGPQSQCLLMRLLGVCRQTKGKMMDLYKNGMGRVLCIA